VIEESALADLPLVDGDSLVNSRLTAENGIQADV
jgi:hypothetical protein